jgi:hypothetical protein
VYWFDVLRIRVRRRTAVGYCKRRKFLEKPSDYWLLMKDLLRTVYIYIYICIYKLKNYSKLRGF